jgi:Flp pilus assembly protein TadD/4-amino-4-deoxy-L-arabinose transferase-like glycosyltransferase
MVVVVALSLRAAYLLEVRNNPLFASPVIDAKMYDDRALEILNGTEVGARALYHAPLYPWALAAVYRIFGHSYLAPRVIQHLLGVLICLLVYSIARAYFDHWVALIAAWLAALYGVFIFFEGELLRTTTAVLLLLAALRLLIWAHQRPTWWRWTLAGLAVGCSVITRENALVLLVCVPLWLAASAGWPGGWRKICGPTVLVCVGAALAIVPVTLRNFSVAHELILVSSQGGLNFYIGNNPEEERLASLQPGLEWEKLRAAPRKLGITTIGGQSRWFYRAACEFIANRPLAWLETMARKLRLFWADLEMMPNEPFELMRSQSVVLRLATPTLHGWSLPFGLAGPLGLLGCLLLRRRWRQLSLLYLFLLTYMGSVVLFHVRARYRVAAVAILLIFAAYAARWLFERARERTILARWKPVAALGCFLVLCSLDPGGLAASTTYPTHYFVGMTYLKQGMFRQCARELEMQLKQDPTWADVHNQLGFAYLQLSELERAQRAMMEARKLDPENASVWYNSGVVYGTAGQPARAESCFRRCVELDATRGECWSRLGVVLLRQRKYAQAVAELEEAVRHRPDHLETKNTLAVAYLRVGREDEARRLWEHILSIDPTNASARSNLGVLSRQRRAPTGPALDTQ